MGNYFFRIRINMKITILISFFALLLSACINKTVKETAINQAPKVTVAPLPTNLRKTIAIARFTNESILNDDRNIVDPEDKIKKQSARLLEHHLVVTQRFNIMERQDIGKLKDDDELLGKKKQFFQQNLKDVDALLVGSIIELKKEDNSNKDGLDKTFAKVAIKFINPETGEIFYRQEGIGEVSMPTPRILGTEQIIGLDSTLEVKAINAAIVNLVNKIVSTFDSSPLPQNNTIN